MLTNRDDILPVLARVIKLLTIGLAINALPDLVPYKFVMSSEFGDIIDTVMWVVHAIGIVILIVAARVAVSVGAPTDG